MDIKVKDKQYIANTYARANLVVASGKGATIYDADGKKYIDLGSGIGVNAFGASDDAWKKAVTEQLDSIQHLSNLYYTLPQIKLAELLVEKSGMERVFFGNSGAEANECAIKCARKYSYDKYGEGRSTIITLENSFHGRTIATLSATGQDVMHTNFFPFLPGFVYTPANDINAMAKAMEDETVCAVMIEIVQGEGGVIPLSDEFIAKTAEMAEAKDILLVIDEVQTGNGRTGAMYSFQHYGLKPDIVSTAKGLGGGLPIGACLFGEKTKDTLVSGTHGSTYGGNPVCAAGAVSVIERLTPEFLAEVIEKGNFIKAELEGAPGVLGITGLGLMIGVAVTKPSAEVIAALLEKGVIALTAKEKVRFLPPLNISFEELKTALDIVKEVLAE
jgi:acetylornithine and succinylornithine aminotransferases